MHTSRINSSYADPSNGNFFYLYVYTALIGGCILLTIIRATAFFKICMRASKTLHDRMFHSILIAPMRFFDTNPTGRILNRFSRDMGVIDEILPRISMDAIQVFPTFY